MTIWSKVIILDSSISSSSPKTNPFKPYNLSPSFPICFYMELYILWLAISWGTYWSLMEHIYASKGSSSSNMEGASLITFTGSFKISSSYLQINILRTKALKRTFSSSQLSSIGAPYCGTIVSCSSTFSGMGGGRSSDWTTFIGSFSNFSAINFAYRCFSFRS